MTVQASTGNQGKLLLLVKIPFFAIFMVAWFIIGGIASLPIFFRSVVFASFVSVSRILKGESIETTIDSIINSFLLWPRGFRHVFQSFFGQVKPTEMQSNKSLSIRSLPFELIIGLLIIFLVNALFLSDFTFIENVLLAKQSIMDFAGWISGIWRAIFLNQQP